MAGSEVRRSRHRELRQDGRTLFAAMSHGLYSFDTASSTQWTPVLQPAGPPSDGENFNLVVGNMITDVAVRPGTNGQQVVAVAGWPQRRADERPVRLQRRRCALQLHR
jgi:hypothetical protein